MSKNLNLLQIGLNRYANDIADDLELNQNYSLLNSSKRKKN
jgi:hypothetical protein